MFTASATEYHLGLLKAKLAKYRAQLLEPSKSAGAKGEGFDVMKSGDARVALVGFPSVGKVGQHNKCFLVWISTAKSFSHLCFLNPALCFKLRQTKKLYQTNHNPKSTASTCSDLS